MELCAHYMIFHLERSHTKPVSSINPAFSQKTERESTLLCQDVKTLSRATGCGGSFYTILYRNKKSGRHGQPRWSVLQKEPGVIVQINVAMLMLCITRNHVSFKYFSQPLIISDRSITIMLLLYSVLALEVLCLHD